MVVGAAGVDLAITIDSIDPALDAADVVVVQADHEDCVRAYVAVNPNDGDFARAEIDRCVARGAIGLKLAAARRCDDPLLDPVIERAQSHGLPVLHLSLIHISEPTRPY